MAVAEGAAPASVDAVAVDPRRRGCFAAIIPGSSPAEYVITTGIASTLNIYNTLLIIRLILTWFPNPPRALVGPLSTLCDPYLGLFRGIVPPLGGLDFSPILAFVSLNFFTNAAAALPAEMPNEDGSMKTAPRPSVAQRLKRLVGADSAKASPEQ
eukprot:PRCOL_00002735-RA